MPTSSLCRVAMSSNHGQLGLRHGTATVPCSGRRRCDGLVFRVTGWKTSVPIKDEACGGSRKLEIGASMGLFG